MNEHSALLLIPVTTMSSREPERAKMAAEGRLFCESCKKDYQVYLRMLSREGETVVLTMPPAVFRASSRRRSGPASGATCSTCAIC